jgi:hypothetical protein
MCNGKSLGFAPYIKEGKNKPMIFLDSTSNPVNFNTKKEAIKFAQDFIDKSKKKI